MREPEYSLETFICEHIASPEEWQEWKDVAGAKAPGTRAVMPTSQSEDIRHEKLPPSPEYLRQQDLLICFVDKTRQTLLNGKWEVWVRTGAPSTRQRLERSDIERGAISLSRNSIGAYGSVQILRAGAETNREVLQRFIETLCSTAGQPGRMITKEFIRDLANRLCGEHFSHAEFAVAWKEARIDPRWKDPGPRRRNSESD